MDLFKTFVIDELERRRLVEVKKKLNSKSYKKYLADKKKRIQGQV